MGNFRLVESFDHAKEKGNGVRKLDLAKILWPESKEKAAHTNMSNLIHGKVKKIDIAAVPIICERLGVTADYLFGISSEPTRSEEFENLRTKFVEYLDKWDEDRKELRDLV
jgi:hypothetical protein